MQWVHCIFYEGNLNMKNIRKSEECIQCQLKTFTLFADKINENERDLYLKKVNEMFENSSEDENTIELIERIKDYFPNYFPKTDFKEIKKRFNEMIMKKIDYIEDKLRKSDDRILDAIKYSIVTNYIDYTAKYSVSDEQLTDLINKANEINLKYEIYQQMLEELSKAKTLLYLTDNCGEIVADKIVLKEIKKKYPKLDITVMVRNESVTNNDATIIDAKQIGLDIDFRVIDNGNRYGGTIEKHLSKDAKEYFNKSDIIISKGQGNVETLLGCGKNIFYMFLCKCEYYGNLFNSKLLDPVLFWEKESYKIYNKK